MWRTTHSKIPEQMCHEWLLTGEHALIPEGENKSSGNFSVSGLPQHGSASHQK